MDITIDDDGFHRVDLETIDKNDIINIRYRKFLQISKLKKQLSNTYYKLIIQTLKGDELKYELSEIQTKINQLQSKFDLEKRE